MTRDQIRERMQRFYRALAHEQELRDELCALEFTGVGAPAAAQSLSRQRQLLKQLEELHQQQVLPLVRELSDFVAAKLQAPASPQPASR